MARVQKYKKKDPEPQQAYLPRLQNKKQAKHYHKQKTWLKGMNKKLKKLRQAKKMIKAKNKKLKKLP